MFITEIYSWHVVGENDFLHDDQMPGPPRLFPLTAFMLDSMTTQDMQHLRFRCMRRPSLG
jgi:hypothetical protein